MSEAPAPPVPGQDPWGEDLNAYLAYVDSKVATLEAQPNGAVMSFNFSTSTDMASIGVGEICFDDVDQESATNLAVSTMTGTGADARLALMSTVPGVILVLQQSGDVNHYALAVMGGDAVDMGSYFVLPLSSVQLASDPLIPGPTGVSAAGVSQAASTSRPPAGPMGPEGVQGVQGEQGPQGEVGPQGPQGETGAAGAADLLPSARGTARSSIPWLGRSRWIETASRYPPAPHWPVTVLCTLRRVGRPATAHASAVGASTPRVCTNSDL